MRVVFAFPFGQPVTACAPASPGPRRVFVLGAYPSALHIRWTPPPRQGLRPVQALAVDNEPEPFWTGHDQDDRIERWKAQVGWKEEWGHATTVANLNGPSGQWVETNVLDRLGHNRAAAWITDCLDTYRASTRMAQVVDTVYRPFASERRLPAADLRPHPTEKQIVDEAIGEHLPRLRRELEMARPTLLVTLGNAALRVVNELIDEPRRLRKLATDRYGDPAVVTIRGVELRWYPLAHPASPPSYQAAHANWRPKP